LAQGLHHGCWQALSGRRSFWRTGADLDAYVGQLAALRAPCWLLTMVNDAAVVDNAPDLADTDAFVGMCRTTHSLSERSRVIICHADYGGLPIVAAGASDVGTGWDRAMRYFDPQSFQRISPGIRIPASYVTQGGLGAVLRRDTADAIVRLGESQATVLRGGPMPPNNAGERVHHLRQLHELITKIDGHGRNRASRVKELRAFYERAIDDFTHVAAQLPRRSIGESSHRRWLDDPYKVLEHYAQAENLW
jgi:hypothetical protein